MISLSLNGKRIPGGINDFDVANSDAADWYATKSEARPARDRQRLARGRRAREAERAAADRLSR